MTGSSIANSFGLSCASANQRAKDNVFNGFATGISTCGGDGRNVIALTPLKNI